MPWARQEDSERHTNSHAKHNSSVRVARTCWAKRRSDHLIRLFGAGGCCSFEAPGTNRDRYQAMLRCLVHTLPGKVYNRALALAACCLGAAGRLLRA